MRRAIKERFETAGLLGPAILLFACAYVLPGLVLVVQSLRQGDGWTAANYLALIQSPAFRVIVMRTLLTAAQVTAITVVIGYPIAYVLARWAGRSAHALLLLISVPYLTSVLIRSYAWQAILGSRGLVNRSLMGLGITDHPIRLVFNEIGTLVGMVHIELPLLVLPLYAAMRRIDPSLTAAAAALGSHPGSAFWHVTRPLARPGLIAGGMLVFLSSLGFFITPVLLGGPGEYLIAQSIQTRATELGDFPGAAAQAVILLAIALMILVFVPLGLNGEDGVGTARSRRRRATTAEDGLRRDHPVGERIRAVALPLLAPLLGAVVAVRRPLLIGFCGLGLVFSIAPIVVVVIVAFSGAPYLTFPPPSYSLRWFRAYFDDPLWLSATGFTLWISAAAALVALLLGSLAAAALVRRPVAGARALHLLLVSPLIVPQIVLAAALFSTFVHLGLIGHPLGFIIGFAVMGVPYVVIIVSAGLRNLDPQLERAAASLGASPLVVLRTVTVPLLAVTLLGALGFAFLAGFDDLVISLFLSTARTATLPLRMWDNIRQEVSPKIAAVAVLFLAAIALAALAIAAVRARQASARATR